MIELIVVITFLAILILRIIFTFKPRLQIAKSNDSKRKADLQRIATALEDYAGDHPCYPEKIYADTPGCNPSDEIKPYLPKISCDPQTKEKYFYLRPDGCSQFVIYTKLQLEEPKYGNASYAVSSPNLAVIPTIYLTPVPTQTNQPATSTPTSPSPRSSPYRLWACFYPGECREISSDQCIGKTFGEPSCSGLCATPAYWCQ